MATTDEAVALRQRLEVDLMALLQKYQDATGLTPKSVDVSTMEMTGLDGSRSTALLSVRVTVEL